MESEQHQRQPVGHRARAGERANNDHEGERAEMEASETFLQASDPARSPKIPRTDKLPGSRAKLVGEAE